MSNLYKQDKPISCPRCKGNYAHIINFGKKGHCWNCRYVWALKWKGGGQYENKRLLV